MYRSVNGVEENLFFAGFTLYQKLLNSESSVRFLVVRHPLLRFYSGWHQKLAKKDPTSSKILSKSTKLQNLAKENLRREFKLLFEGLRKKKLKTFSKIE